MSNEKPYLGLNGETATPIVFDIFSDKCMPNNWLKMHGRPMRRKPLKKLNTNLLVMGKTGNGMSFSEKMRILRNNQ